MKRLQHLKWRQKKFQKKFTKYQSSFKTCRPKKHAFYNLSTALNLKPTFKLEKSAFELGTVKCKVGRAKDAVDADAIVFAFA
jgi:hypothetical protein